ncbi:hypothetical protein [Acidiphilium sp. C61]|uniref:hypothetical protein n=1 Tax=Acidiphilium sp. C61 TaxID=1671485 RepID=UPI00157AFABC|nr:hypothetical protein [Acidiphilium sp. C61]
MPHMLERRDRRPARDRKSAVAVQLVCALTLGLALVAGTAHGQTPSSVPSFTATDIKVLNKLLIFLRPAVKANGIIAIAYRSGNAASKADAEAIAAMIGHGFMTGTAHLRPVPVPANRLLADKFEIIIPADETPMQEVAAASASHHALCVTSHVARVRAGTCTLGIVSQQRVTIVLNTKAAHRAGVSFAAALLLMIEEV